MTIADHALHGKLPKLAVDFFVAFSRFECAMKRSGTYARGDESGVEPDWNGLARDLGDAFFAEVKTRNVAPLLIGSPPKKQIKQADGSLGWRDVGAVANASDLFVAIRRARNNLLHGGKYRDDRDGNYSEVDGTERSDALLSQSLAVLELALHAKQEIRERF
ncbi:hypothetical protein CO653_08255 [Rhizobium anhuiense]|uniref:hypothetical protein n=1 Tax=Rhizobium anhuiense TaxID=1184720 RepID=UPI000BEA4215|nr:hypothetical protein [Rhizobium anhuiense]PDS66691.1 hypothetical protein CO653_08255 [Rhizobium anhuiense]